MSQHISTCLVTSEALHLYDFISFGLCTLYLFLVALSLQVDYVLWANEFCNSYFKETQLAEDVCYVTFLVQLLLRSV